jgi:hypothetical protein
MKRAIALLVCSMAVPRGPCRSQLQANEARWSNSAADRAHQPNVNPILNRPLTAHCDTHHVGGMPMELSTSFKPANQAPYEAVWR